MSTGENETGLRKIADMTRVISLTLLCLHYYYFFYHFFLVRGIETPLTDRLLENIEKTGLFRSFFTTKWMSLGALFLSLLGLRTKKNDGVKFGAAILVFLSGILLYGLSSLLLILPLSEDGYTLAYILVTSIGYLLSAHGITRLSRLIRLRMMKDIFNEESETFPQEERLLTNEYSINLAARYRLRNKIRSSWINIINPFRGLLVAGTPGAGKSYFIIRHIIHQHIEKGFSMFVYDYKFDDLSRIAYSCLSTNRNRYGVSPQFHVICFDNLSQSSRCNPLDPGAMHDITDASESARTILLGLNREWINKQGDFFVESPINFLTAVIWFLRRYENGRYCTLPHVIELMQTDYPRLFPILNTEPEIEVLINPFVSAYQNDAMEQLEGQIASAKIGMARLSSPQLYWVLAGNDFTLDINNPAEPKIVCMGNNPEKQQIYGAVLSLYIARLIRQVNKKGRLPCSLIFDEFPTIFFNHMDGLIATARSNRVATTLAMQDFSQLRKDYGKDAAEVIVNITGNIICGAVMGDTARMLSERMGKIKQKKESISINRMDTSISHSAHLDFAVPAAKISRLSAGEFVGMVTDNPDEPIKLKMFHAQIVQTDTKEEKLVSLPAKSSVTQEQIRENYHQIRLDVKRLVDEIEEKLKNH